MSHDSDCIQGYEHLIMKEYKIGKKWIKMTTLNTITILQYKSSSKRR